MRAPFAGVRVATIDPYDVAAVSAAALAGGHEGRNYRLSGPESLLPADRVSVLARVLGRDQMSGAMPAQYVDAFFSFFADGKLDESEVLPTVREVTGRHPRTFEQWARAHVDAFR